MIETFRQAYPDAILLPQLSIVDIEAYLRGRQWIDDVESVQTVAIAGEGNMNFTLRVTTNTRSLILKQSVPWVAKYPHIEAPWDRVIREARFYHMVSQHSALAQAMPTLLDLDVSARIALFEDLGAGRDGSCLYQGAAWAMSDLEAAVSWLSTLHHTPFDSRCRSALTNRDMRALNHEHIFIFPYQAENGIDLDAITPGLQAVADSLKQNDALVAAVQALGERFYLSDGSTLLHGDFFPGSWLLTDAGLKVIDPEFAFFGSPEFDVGVLLAHLYLSDQPHTWITRAQELYRHPASFSSSACQQIVGAEIIRRIIGVAQLPLNYGLAGKQDLLTQAAAMVLAPENQALG